MPLASPKEAPMKILIAATPLTGHVNPLLAVVEDLLCTRMLQDKDWGVSLCKIGR